MSASRATTRAVTLVAVGVLALAGAGCAKHKDAKGGSGDNGDSAFIGGAPTSAPPVGSGTGSGTGSDNGNTNTGQNSGNQSPAPQGPVISYFRIKQKPQCPQGTNVNPIPGVDLIVEWSVSGADKVTLAVDGPGVYNTYGPKGSETFSFGCGDGKAGDTVKHTYLLVAEKDGVQAKKTLVASAKVYEIGQV